MAHVMDERIKIRLEELDEDFTFIERSSRLW